MSLLQDVGKTQSQNTRTNGGLVQSKQPSLYIHLPDKIILKIFRFIVCQEGSGFETLKTRLNSSSWSKYDLVCVLAEKYGDLKICMLACKRFNNIGSDFSLWFPLAKLMRVDEKLKPELSICKQIRMVHLHAKEFIYPFDPLIARIERAINKRIAGALNWKLSYSFNVVGTTIFRRVSRLEGKQFRLYFSRIQGKQGELGGVWNNTAGGVDSIAIPKLKLPTSYDFSGGLAVYIGDGWEMDRKQFFDSYIYEDDEHDPPKHLYYKSCIHNSREKTWTGLYRAPTRFFTRELKYSRQITPSGQPYFYEREEVYQKITKFLEEEILESIKSLK